MICRNCSAVLPDDCEKCPVCGRKPDLRNQGHKTAVCVVMITLLLLLSCTAVAVKINSSFFHSVSAPTETTAFFALEETTEIQSESETDTVTETETETETEESTEEETEAETEKPDSDGEYVVETFGVTDKSGKAIAKRAVIRADKEDFKKNGKERIGDIRKNLIFESRYSWFTVDFGDKTGIVFLSDGTHGASYGKIDGSGLISELFGILIISSDNQYSYFPVNPSVSEETTTDSSSETAQSETETKTSETTTVKETKASAQTTTKVKETDTETNKETTAKDKTTVKPTEKEETEKATKAETTSQKSKNDTASVVYITDTGTKFHRADCSSLSKSKTEISRSEALKQGYEACKRCKP